MKRGKPIKFKKLAHFHLQSIFSQNACICLPRIGKDILQERERERETCQQNQLRRVQFSAYKQRTDRSILADSLRSGVGVWRAQPRAALIPYLYSISFNFLDYQLAHFCWQQTLHLALIRRWWQTREGYSSPRVVYYTEEHRKCSALGDCHFDTELLKFYAERSVHAGLRGGRVSGVCAPAAGSVYSLYLPAIMLCQSNAGWLQPPAMPFFIFLLTIYYSLYFLFVWISRHFGKILKFEIQTARSNYKFTGKFIAWECKKQIAG